MSSSVKLTLSTPSGICANEIVTVIELALDRFVTASREGLGMPGAPASEEVIAGVCSPLAGSTARLPVLPLKLIVKSLPGLFGVTSNELESEPGVQVSEPHCRLTPRAEWFANRQSSPRSMSK